MQHAALLGGVDGIGLEHGAKLCVNLPFFCQGLQGIHDLRIYPLVGEVHANATGIEMHGVKTRCI